MDDLYRYAGAHTMSLSLVNGSITASDPAVLQDLNGKIMFQEMRRQVLLKTKREYAQMQAQVFRALAIDPKSAGLQ